MYSKVFWLFHSQAEAKNMTKHKDYHNQIHINNARQKCTSLFVWTYLLFYETAHGVKTATA